MHYLLGQQSKITLHLKAYLKQCHGKSNETRHLGARYLGADIWARGYLGARHLGARHLGTKCVVAHFLQSSFHFLKKI